MRLFHFSENPGIARFEPRPVRIPSQRSPGRDWLNGPLVWAIDSDHDFLYLFPRDCPRIVAWATPATSDADRRLLGEARAIAYVENAWHERLTMATLHRYEFPADGFEDLRDAGMWVARHTVTPIECAALTRLDAALAARQVTLHLVDSLKPLKPLWNTTLHVSGVRLRNALDWA